MLFWFKEGPEDLGSCKHDNEFGACPAQECEDQYQRFLQRVEDNDGHNKE